MLRFNLKNLERNKRLKLFMILSEATLKYPSFKKIKNILLNTYEMKRRRTILKSKPYFIKIEPTNKCNLNCRFCPGNTKKNNPKGEMSIADFKRIIDKIGDFTSILVLNLWGESTLNKDLPEMINYAHNKKICTYLSTNLNIGKKQLKKIFNSELDFLIVSIDSTHQDIHSRFRKKYSFCILNENLNYLTSLKKTRSKRPDIIIQFLVNKYNEDQILEVKRLAENFDGLNIFPTYVFNKREWLSTNPKYNHSFYREQKRKRKKKCNLPYYHISIRWDGSVLPCCLKYFDKSYGNLLINNFELIWNNPPYVSLRQSLNNEPVCYKCEFL